MSEGAETVVKIIIVLINTFVVLLVRTVLLRLIWNAAIINVFTVKAISFKEAALMVVVAFILTNNNSSNIININQ